MLRIALLLVMVFTLSIAGGPIKMSVKKVAKPDSATKIDTVMIITNDSLQITEIYKDTSILVKCDTVKIPGKIKRVIPVKAAPVMAPAVAPAVVPAVTPVKK